MERFPIGRITDTPAEGRRGPCPNRVTWTDTFSAPRSGGRIHQAQDIFAPHGSEVVAPDEGRVLDTYHRRGEWRMGGRYLHLRTEDGRRWYFGHLATVDVRPGQRVRAGDVLGTVGQTGNASHSCPHLHLQVRGRSGTPLNIAEELRIAQQNPTDPAGAGRTEVETCPH
jgi:murein DD-endopeptidase MepM/ murein hydrolase activator NlpD